MSEHVIQWLNAYQDGELRGGRLHHVETHLAACEMCQQALEDLYHLSALLHEAPAPEFTSPERLAAQVNLRLPRVRSETPEHKVWEVGWWLIPVSLLSVWVLVMAIGLIGDVVTTANRWGLLDTLPIGTFSVGRFSVNVIPEWITGASAEANWTGILAGFGLLSGESLTWATTLEGFVRDSLPQFIWQVSIAVLYLGWLTIWWVRHTRQEHDQLLEASVLSSQMK